MYIFPCMNRVRSLVSFLFLPTLFHSSSFSFTHIPDSSRLTLLTRWRCSVVGLRAQWQTAAWQRCRPRGAVFLWQQVLHAIQVSVYVCLSGGTYMDMKETWQLLEIIHFHVAFKIVCGAPTYYVLYIRMLTRPHTDVAFCVKWTERVRRLYSARTLCNICVCVLWYWEKYCKRYKSHQVKVCMHCVRKCFVIHAPIYIRTYVHIQ